MPQLTQSWPLPPHELVARGVHVEPTQQPVTQLAAHPLQVPLMQASPVAEQVWQAMPPRPH